MATTTIPRSVFFVIPLLLFRVLSMDAETSSPLSVELRSDTGILYGKSKELVYTYADSDVLLSRLDWVMEPLFYWGMRVDLAYTLSGQNGPFAGFGLKSGIPAMTGTMTDTDWLNYDGVKTHFSAHDCHTEQAFFFDARAGWSFAAGRAITLRAFVDVEYARFRWTARDGYLQYAPAYTAWTSSIEKIPVYGTGIAYEQEWLFAGVGLEAAWQASDRLRLTASCTAFPLVACEDQDDHYLREVPLQFNDSLRGGYAVEPRLECAFRLTESSVIAFHGAYRLAAGLRGDVQIMEIGTGSFIGYEENTAGAELNVLDAGVSFTVKL